MLAGRLGSFPSDLPTQRCAFPVQRSNGSRTCGFFLVDELILGAFPLKRLPFLLTSRYEPTRDLLLAPIKHATNRELAEGEIFWDLVNQLVQYFQGLLGDTGDPLEGVALNFGKWETANLLDASIYALDCHGHAHLLLTPELFYVLEDNKDFLPLRGRFTDPNLHLREDCRDLEVEGLIAAENEDLRNRMDRDLEVEGLIAA